MREVWKDGRTREVTRVNGKFASWKIVTPEPTPFFEPEEPELFYRTSVGLNFVVTHKYFGALVQEWFSTEQEAWDALPRLTEQILKMVENYVGYSRSLWWFDSVVGESVQEVYEREEPYAIIERKA